MSAPDGERRRVGSDFPFIAGLCILSGTYVLFIVALLIADLTRTTAEDWRYVLGSADIRYAIKLSLISCSITTILSLWVAVPIGYLMSRFRFPFKKLLDAILDVPIVLPPLVIGLSLLILFNTRIGGISVDAHLEAATRALLERVGFKDVSGLRFTYTIPGVILAQFMVACAFAVRTMRASFNEIPARHENVALTLGCTRSQAFWLVAFPEARRGVLVAATLAWARSLGEFGPILVFAGATRMRTEVLPTTVFLELSIGNIEAAAAVSLLMVIAAVIVLVIVRTLGKSEQVPL